MNTIKKDSLVPTVTKKMVLNRIEWKRRIHVDDPVFWYKDFAIPSHSSSSDEMYFYDMNQLCIF